MDSTVLKVLPGVTIFIAMSNVVPPSAAAQEANLLPDASSEAMASVTLDADAARVRRNPMIFGGFLEHFDRQIYGGIFEPGSPLSDERGFRRDVIEAMKELKLAIVRWPGGCFASGYHWRDGVGEARKPTSDKVWGVEDPNTFGTDEFLEWCQLVGCQPYICTNAGNGTPAEMAEWVQYCNRRASSSSPLPRVKIWSIGNENWGAHEIGARTPQEWGPLVADSARMMLNVDPHLDLVAAATPSRDWTLPLLGVAGEHLDYVAIHQYWIPCWGENITPDYVSCIMRSQGPEETIASVIKVLDTAGVRGRIKIAFDEWNLRGWHHPGFPRKEISDSTDPAVAELIKNREKNDIASQYSMADALFSASFLNACLRHADDVGMANSAPIVNTRGPLYVHPKGIVKRTTFHTLSMYANELQEDVVKTDVAAGMLVQGKEFIPALDALATVNASGKTWSVAMVNRHPSQELTCALSMKGVPLEGPAEATVLSGASPDDYNDIEHPDRVVPEKRALVLKEGVVRLPAHSLTILTVSPHGGSGGL